MPAHCFTDGDKGICFVEDGKVYGFSLEELCPSGDESALMVELDRMFQDNPSWGEAFEKKVAADIFCRVCGHWCFDNREGLAVCAECGEPVSEALDGPLVPEILVEAIRVTAQPPDPDAPRVEADHPRRPGGGGDRAQDRPHELSAADQLARASEAGR